MRYIKKNSPPPSLQEYKRKTAASYNEMDADVMKDLQKSLLDEQKGVCAYCQQKLKKDFTIEHHCERSICNGKDGKPDRTMDYTNLFAVCDGKGVEDTHCDTKKSEFSIKNGLPMELIPTNKAHNQTIRYSSNGIIESTNEKFDNELSKLLNLNIDYLKDLRRIKWINIYKNSKDKTGKFNKNKMRKIIESELLEKPFADSFPGLSEFMLGKFC